MVDKVISYSHHVEIITVKNVTANEPHFNGHFPDYAIMPGALILEGLAQSAILLFALSNNKKETTEKPLYLFGNVEAKFIQPVIPGDQLIFKVNVVKMISNAAVVTGIATVNQQIITKAQLTFKKK